MGSAASLQSPELTSVLLQETKRTYHPIDLTDMANEDNSIFLILYYNKTELLNDLKSCFDGVTTIPDYFNVKEEPGFLLTVTQMMLSPSSTYLQRLGRT
jgi:hypothetical protein